MVQRRALMEGQAFATRMRDFKSAERYAQEARLITESLDMHWDGRVSQIISSKSSSRPNRLGLDSSIILATIQTDVPFGGSIDSFAPYDEYVFNRVKP